MMNLAYGPARPTPAEERSQFGLQNWLLPAMAVFFVA